MCNVCPCPLRVGGGKSQRGEGGKLGTRPQELVGISDVISLLYYLIFLIIICMERKGKVNEIFCDKEF